MTLPLVKNTHVSLHYQTTLLAGSSSLSIFRKQCVYASVFYLLFAFFGIYLLECSHDMIYQNMYKYMFL